MIVIQEAQLSQIDRPCDVLCR